MCVSIAPHHAIHKRLIPHWLIHLGLLGVFILSLLDASVIPLPIPGSTDLLILLLTANRGNPWFLVPAAVTGSAIGGYLTWSAGKKGGENVLGRHVPKRFLNPVTRWVKRHGVLTVGVASIAPPPIPLMPFLLAAGALGVPKRSFLVSIIVARGARYSLVAWLGVNYGRRVIHAWSQYSAGWYDTIIWILAGLLVAGVLFGVWKYRHSQRRFASSAHAAR